MPETPTRCRSVQLLRQIRPELFWDTDPHQLDPQSHAQYIIERVAERGTLEEMRAIWSHYGADRIAETLQASRALTPRTMWFFSALFHVPLASFRSYTQDSNHAVAS